MNIFKFLPLLLVLPVCALGAGRGDVKRSGGSHGGTANLRMSVTSMMPKVDAVKQLDVNANKGVENTTSDSGANKDKSVENDDGSSVCRDAYRECMDSFCLLDENQGERCACSDNINRAKTKLKEVLDIQAEADKLFTEGVEREQLGAKARLVFTEETAGNAKVSGKSFMDWLYDKKKDDGDVGEDTEIGDNLLYMASEY